MKEKIKLILENEKKFEGMMHKYMGHYCEKIVDISREILEKVVELAIENGVEVEEAVEDLDCKDFDDLIDIYTEDLIEWAGSLDHVFYLDMALKEKLASSYVVLLQMAQLKEVEETVDALGRLVKELCGSSSTLEAKPRSRREVKHD